MPLRLPVSLAAAALAGLLLAASFEPVGLAVLLPLGVALLVVSVHGRSPRSAWLPGLVCGAIFLGTHLWWMRAVGPDAWVGIVAIETAFFAPLGSLLAALQRLRWWPVWTAVLWVAVEDLRMHWPMSGMPWGRLSQGVSETIWQPSLPWLGASGTSLVIALTGTTLAWVAVSGRRRPAAVVAAAGALAAATVAPVLAAPLLTGAEPGAEPDSMTVAIVQGNVPGGGTDLVAVHREVTASHVRLTQQLAEDVAAGTQERPDVVLWPENSTAVDPFLDAGTAAGLEAASSTVGVPILVGALVDARDPDHVLNQGIVWEPGVGATDRYTKQNPVPFGEYIPWRDSLVPSDFGQLRQIGRDMLSGSEPSPLRLGEARVADVICFDVAYDDAVLGQVAQGAELVTVQTSNALFAGTPQLAQQFEITRLRAVETGRWVAIASVNGISGVISPTGEVVQTLPQREAEVLVEEVGLRTHLTPAVRMGLWPRRAIAAVAVAACLVWVSTAIARYRRPDARTQTTGPQRPVKGTV